MRTQAKTIARSIEFSDVAENLPIKIGQNIFEKNTIIKIVHHVKKPNEVIIKNVDNKEHIVLHHKIKGNGKFIAITHYTVSTQRLLDKILRNILIANICVLIAIIYIAMFLSRSMLIPIKVLARNLTKMNERSLSQVDTNELYKEFVPLGVSLNKLIHRIQTFIKYQTEFFVGIAHELKTPLAVMKTKNEVTLMKNRDDEYYKVAIEQNIKSVDEMNQMISALLEIGRQEGAQLNPPEEVDLVTFIKEKANGFRILAKLEKKDIVLDIQPSSYIMLTQPTLVLHVVQNFVQNAIKFSPPNGIITIKTRGNDNGFNIEVLDNGCGLNEDIDVFAPFKRIGNKSGVGLGLYLAKGAAQSLHAHISVKNRKDAKGAIATVFIPHQPTTK